MSLEKYVISLKRKLVHDNHDDNKIKNAREESNSDDNVQQIVVIPSTEVKWKNYSGENLNLAYTQLFSRKEADCLLHRCENELEYNTGELSKVQIFGKWHNIPRKQVAHGDSGLSYTFSGQTIPARAWLPLTTMIRDQISSSTGYEFNFVLINRYKDGCDYVGEHKDDERDLVAGHPIASLSLGQVRDFVFKHQDSRGKKATRKITPVKLVLQHGSLLLMKHPTNNFWYHSLPPRKKLSNVRVNMTFRKMVIK